MRPLLFTVVPTKRLTDLPPRTIPQKYTSAIEIDSSNPVYFSNRAAAHSSLGNHEGAVTDAQAAIQTNPSFVKGYSRLGCVSSAF